MVPNHPVSDASDTESDREESPPPRPTENMLAAVIDSPVVTVVDRPTQHEAQGATEITVQSPVRQAAPHVTWILPPPPPPPPVEAPMEIDVASPPPPPQPRTRPPVQRTLLPALRQDMIVSNAELQDLRNALRETQQQIAQMRKAQVAPVPLMNKKTEQSLWKALERLEPFEGGDKARNFKLFLAEFTNVAGQIPDMKDEDMLPLMHAHVKGAALKFATTAGLVDSKGRLAEGLTFDEYCDTMKNAMISDQKSLLALVNDVLDVTMEGRFTNPRTFLQEKETRLNLIDAHLLSEPIRAVLAMIGMSPGLLASISPNPKSLDGQFHLYSDVRRAAVHALGVDQMLTDNSKRVKFARDKQNPWQSQKGFGKEQGTAEKAGAGPSHPHAEKAQDRKRDYSKALGKNRDHVCKDCGKEGHWDNGYWGCTKNPVTKGVHKKAEKAKGPR